MGNQKLVRGSDIVGSSPVEKCDAVPQFWVRHSRLD